MTAPSKVLSLRDRNGETIPVNASPQAEAGTGPLVVTGTPEKPMVRPSARGRRRGPWLMLSALLLIVGPTLLAVYYYTQIATDQYIAEFKLSVRGGVDRGGGGDAGGAGAAGMVGGMIADAFVVTELINSRQMVADVSNDVDLRALFSNPKADWWSRLRLPASKEDVVDYWKKVVSAQFDMLTGIVTVTVRTFNPEDSLKLARAITKAADQAVFKMSERARQDLVRFADDEVKRAEANMQTTRIALRDFRIREQIIDAGRTAQASSDLAGKLREDLSRMKQELASIAPSLSPTAPQITLLRSRIGSTEAEINRMGRSIGEGGGKSASELSPTTLAQFDSLNAELDLAQKSYAVAQEGRQRAQIAADRRTTYVTLFVEPSLPDAALYPQRVQSVLLVGLLSLVGWFLGLLVVASIRDHLL
jgi:capsular polysaccharide transport system permease protein